MIVPARLLGALLGLALLAGCSDDSDPPTGAPAADGPVDATAVRPPDPGPGSGDNWISIEHMAVDAIDVIWSDVDGAREYALYRLDEPALDDPGAAVPEDGEVVYRGPDTTYVDRDLASGARYLYIVVAETASGRTEPRWREGVAVDDTQPPSPVGALTAERGPDGVLLRWEASSEDYRFSAYDVRQRMDDGTFAWIGGAYAREQTAFRDDRAAPREEIVYEVVARDFHGNLSDPRRITVPPA